MFCSLLHDGADDNADDCRMAYKLDHCAHAGTRGLGKPQTSLEQAPYHGVSKQESPAIADKPARRESLPKIAPLRRAYNVVADNTGLSSCV